ncbi:MAG TPA: hypothetical protein VHY35_24105 [Stellaceae bacterium]|jgi:hypothetical protein|nr:hypothetical protein [Stellaceae bacterium]
MSTLDEIEKERQRLAERLEKIDSERARVAEQLAELEAAERVLMRLTQGRAQSRMASSQARSPLAGRGRRGARQAASEVEAAVASGRGRPSRRSTPDEPALSLGDATLQAVGAHADGISAEGVRQYLATALGMEVRPNHLGMALQRHRRAGRLEQRDLLWFSGEAASR